MGNRKEFVQSDEISGWVVMDSKDRYSITSSNGPHVGDETEVNSWNANTSEHLCKKMSIVESLCTQTMVEQNVDDAEFNGNLFDLVVEDSLEREDLRARPFDLNKLPEEEEVQSNMKNLVDRSTETILVRKDGHQFDLNKFPEDECDEDSNAEKERKRFIRSMLKHYFPDFY